MTTILRKQRAQLPLHLPLEAATAREDLVVSDSNRHAVEFIDSWPEWPTSLAILNGDHGSGKSHLCQVWAARSDALFLRPNLHVPESIEPSTNYVVEDITQGSFNEVWLFHLLNTAMSTGNFVVLTTRRAIESWGVVLPDLSSRLNSAHKMFVSPPDDFLLSGVLFKLFSDRQLQVDKSTVDFLISRMERSLAFALRLVESIDSASLADQRSVTRPLASRVLDELARIDNAYD